ncbi:MAG TPA: SigB/SigF/SigG family RNA polymerase sigma factor [Candidatus Dormibacteraeota bacterium]|nr:SigB/SigF/SigG family RNA polymerase sigma factor [Candidatus Dormibacteraeota bacterium]
MASSSRIPREELRALHRRYKETTDPSERERIRAQLVDAYHDFVYFLARKFQNRGEPLDDIVQVGYLGLIKAIDRFDPDLGYEFTTFATLTVAGEIKRYFRDKGTAIRFPRRLQELHQSVVRVNEQMKVELGRDPTVGELAERLGVSPDDVTEAMEMGSAYVPVSLDQPISGADGQDNRSVAEQIGGPDLDLERVEMRDVLDRAMEHLTPRERAIMAMRFYEQMSQSEIARRLGISQMHVSRLQRAALEQLRKHVPEEATQE